MKTGGIAPTDLEVLRQARPYVRSVLAFLIYLRNGEKLNGLTAAYLKADEFLGHLHDDVEKAESHAAG